MYNHYKFIQIFIFLVANWACQYGVILRICASLDILGQF
jgi:hypothetical protein